MQRQLDEFPVAQWPSLLDHFSRAHHGQNVDLVIVAPDSGRHQEAHDLPLLGISAEPSDGEQRITIMAASPDGPHITHEIEHPTHLRFAEWNDGVSAQLEIDAANGFSARVRVGPSEQTIPPGAILDGNYERQ